MPDILTIPVPVTNAALVWPGRNASGINTLLLVNKDLNNVVYVGNQSNITANGQNVIPIAPNGTMSVDPASSWYVIGAAAGIIPLVMVPNGQSYFLGLTQGNGKLAIPSMQSPDYVAGVSGWSINADGTAEFNNVSMRGSSTSATLTAGNTVVIDQKGIFVYNGPARGVTPPTNAGGTGGSQTSNIPNTCTVSVSGGEPGQTWTLVSNDGVSTAVFQAVA